MKIFFALLMLVACAAALPQVSNKDLAAERRDLAQIITEALDRFKERIRNRGLDPYELQRAEGEYVFILPTVFSAKAWVEDLRFTGLSNIVLHDIGYSLLSNQLTIDISMPSLMVVVGDSGFDIIAAGREISGKLSGLLAVNGLGVKGKATVSLSRVSVSDMEVDARLDSIQSALNIRIYGLDISTPVNNWLTNLPGNLALHHELIGRGLARLIQILVNHYFP